MKITVEFENEDEFEAFRTSGKKTRGKGKDKDDAGDTPPAGGAPAPMLPPAGGAAGAFTGFAPPAGGAAPGPGFGAPVAQQGPDPAVADLVRRIVARVDAALASGQNTDAALNWFRTECGPNAAQATFDQIKTHHLFQQQMDKLAHIAKVMNA